MSDRTATREDVSKAIDALIESRRLRLTREDEDGGKRVEWYTLPPLWDQLAQSVSYRASSGGSSAFASRPTVATGIVALLRDVEMWVVKACDEHMQRTPAERLAEMEAQEYTAQRRVDDAYSAYCEATRIAIPDEGDPAYEATLENVGALLDETKDAWEAALADFDPIHDRAEHKRRTLVPDSLRALAANLVDSIDFAFWSETIRDWASQITEALALDPIRPQHAGGTPCPDCHAETVTRLKLVNGRKERVTLPAIEITWTSPDDDGASYRPPERWVVSQMRCCACGQVWRRGPELDSLVDETIRRRKIKALMLSKLGDTA